MNDAEAKKHLQAVLRAYTHGSVLHLLADLLRDAADRAGDDARHRQFAEVAATLYVVGIGIDAARENRGRSQPLGNPFHDRLAEARPDDEYNTDH